MANLFPSPDESLSENDLSKSGLSLSSVSWAGVYHTTDASDTLKTALKFERPITHAIPALVFPYYDIDAKGKTTKSSAFFRIKPFTPITKSKYIQIGAGCKAYVPPIGNWDDFVKDDTLPLIIVEGEKKALAACNRGLCAIAIGGKDSYQSSKANIALLPEIELLAKGRTVYVVFDSDKDSMTLRPDVKKSAEKLIWQLRSKGCPRPLLTLLPSELGVKTALDDWLMSDAASNKSSDQLIGLLEGLSVQDEAIRDLADLFDKYVYVREANAVVKLDTRRLIDIKSWKDEFGNDKVNVRELGKKKTGSIVVPAMVLVTKKLGEAFLEHPSRPTMDKLMYYPKSELPIVEAEIGGRLVKIVNRYPGLVPKPFTGEVDVSIFLNFVREFHLQDAEYMLNWYLIQIKYPGIKPFSVPVLSSHEEGLGKSIIPQLLIEHVFGPGGASFSPGDLKKMTDRDIAEKLFILFDDLNSDSMRAAQSFVKGAVTRRILSVEHKFLRRYDDFNWASFILTSNMERLVLLSQKDRRFAPVECSTAFLTSTGTSGYATVHPRVKELIAWFQNDHGGAKLLAYAHVHDFGAFDPHAAAPMTRLKREQQEMSKSDIDIWAEDLAKNADKYSRELVTAEEVRDEMHASLRYADGVEVSKIPMNSPITRRALRTAGIVSIGVFNVTVDGKKTTRSVYALRNHDKWEKAEEFQVRSAVERCKFAKLTVSSVKDGEVVDIVKKPKY